MKQAAIRKKLFGLRNAHKRVPLDEAAIHKFGYCNEHPERQNEYYDRIRNEAFCTLCAIEMA
jgi:hypothetical protein